MAVHLNAVADEYRKVSDQQMADTVKRNLRENVAINIQLSKMTDTLKDLIRVRWGFPGMRSVFTVNREK